MSALLLLLLHAASCAAAELKPRYDVVVVGTGLKESLLAGLLASHGKEVLQLAGRDGPSTATRDLRQLAEATEGPIKLPESKLGLPSEYSVEVAPKMFIASGKQLQIFVQSGTWQHMNPPGFKRVHRSLI